MDKEIFLNLIIYWGYFLTFIAAVGAIAFPIYGIVKAPAKAKTVLIGVAGILFIFLIGYFSGSGEIPEKFIDSDIGLTETTVKMVNGSLIALYIIGVGAILSIFVSEGVRVFRRAQK